MRDSNQGKQYIRTIYLLTMDYSLAKSCYSVYKFTEHLLTTFATRL